MRLECPQPLLLAQFQLAIWVPCHCPAGQVRTFFYWSSVFIGIMNYSSQEITAPWLLPEMVERVATMLNYFLRHLAGNHLFLRGRGSTSSRSCRMQAVKALRKDEAARLHCRRQLGCEYRAFVNMS